MLKYQQIATEIEKYIEYNALQHGDKLPVLDVLIAQFEVSKSTITKSLDLLEKKGLIFQVRGSGIFARKNKRRGYINLLSNQGFIESIDGNHITSEVIDLEVIWLPSQEVAHYLNIGSNDYIYFVKRIQYINGQIQCLEESFYNKSIIPYLNKEIIAESILDYIREGLGLKVGFSDIYLNVDKINEEEAKYLDLEKGTPKLSMQTIFHLTNGHPFKFSKATYNYEYSHFLIQTS